MPPTPTDWLQLERYESTSYCVGGIFCPSVVSYYTYVFVVSKNSPVVFVNVLFLSPSLSHTHINTHTYIHTHTHIDSSNKLRTRPPHLLTDTNCSSVSRILFDMPVYVKSTPWRSGTLASRVREQQQKGIHLDISTRAVFSFLRCGQRKTKVLFSRNTRCGTSVYALSVQHSNNLGNTALQPMLPASAEPRHDAAFGPRHTHETQNNPSKSWETFLLLLSDSWISQRESVLNAPTFFFSFFFSRKKSSSTFWHNPR